MRPRGRLLVDHPRAGSRPTPPRTPGGRCPAGTTAARTSARNSEIGDDADGAESHLVRVGVHRQWPVHRAVGADRPTGRPTRWASARPTGTLPARASAGAPALSNATIPTIRSRRGSVNERCPSNCAEQRVEQDTHGAGQRREHHRDRPGWSRSPSPAPRRPRNRPRRRPAPMMPRVPGQHDVGEQPGGEPHDRHRGRVRRLSPAQIASSSIASGVDAEAAAGPPARRSAGRTRRRRRIAQRRIRRHRRPSAAGRPIRLTTPAPT